MNFTVSVNILWFLCYYSYIVPIYTSCDAIGLLSKKNKHAQLDSALSNIHNFLTEYWVVEL